MNTYNPDQEKVNACSEIILKYFKNSRGLKEGKQITENMIYEDILGTYCESDEELLDAWSENVVESLSPEEKIDWYEKHYRLLQDMSNKIHELYDVDGDSSDPLYFIGTAMFDILHDYGEEIYKKISND